MLYNHTYNDSDDVFEREPLLVHIRDLTAMRMSIIIMCYIVSYTQLNNGFNSNIHE